MHHIGGIYLTMCNRRVHTARRRRNTIKTEGNGAKVRLGGHLSSFPIPGRRTYKTGRRPYFVCPKKQESHASLVPEILSPSDDSVMSFDQPATLISPRRYEEVDKMSLTATTSFLSRSMKRRLPMNRLLKCFGEASISVCRSRDCRRSFLSKALTRRLDMIISRHDEILSAIENSPESGFTHGKELASLAQVVSLDARRKNLDEEEYSIQELLKESGDEDEDLKEEFKDELERIQLSKIRIEKKLKGALLPKDENDFESNAIVEIRAGTGGDEATLFASELRETYEKTARAMRWECDIMSESRTDLGGIKETVLSISGRNDGGMMFSGCDEDDSDEEGEISSSVGPFGLFRYESGVHRVQRVPVNDTRIHTSACSVAVLPLLQNDEKSGELLPMSELKIETMRASGAGGQHVNTTDSAVRITHIPTGITASIQDERSQHKNKDKALKLISARVREAEREEENRKRGAARSSLLGGGDRSERIRTYNYPQDRVTDHRCKETTHGISKLLDGGSHDGLVVTFFPYLRSMVREEQLNELEKEQSSHETTDKI